MNPLLVRAGVFAVITAATFFYYVFKKYSNTESQHVRGETWLGSRSSEKFDGSFISNCCICLQEFKTMSGHHEVLSLPCKHKFHKECIGIVLNSEANSRKTCPVCRQLVPESFISRVF